jgi:hypothetical protein
LRNVEIGNRTGDSKPDAFGYFTLQQAAEHMHGAGKTAAKGYGLPGPGHAETGRSSIRQRFRKRKRPQTIGIRLEHRHHFSGPNGSLNAKKIFLNGREIDIKADTRGMVLQFLHKVQGELNIYFIHAGSRSTKGQS